MTKATFPTPFTLTILAVAMLVRIDVCFGLSPGNVTITPITPYAAIDSNNCSGPEGPHAMYLQVNVTNNTAAALTNVQAVLNGFAASTASPPNPPPSFALDHGESASRFVGALGAGATAALYWYVNYPCSGSINYTVTVSDSQPGTVTNNPSFTLATRFELSAQAGGDINEQTIQAGLVIGQTVKITVHYLFGNPAASADAMVQPAGNVSFNGFFISNPHFRWLNNNNYFFL
jgi:hypothetical protein